MSRLDGKTALVTGAARGIGLATTKLFLEEGWQVAMIDRDGETLAGAVATLDHVHGIDCDVSHADEVAEMVAETLDRFGAIDALVNNAGVVRLPADHPDPTPEAAYDFVMDINMKALYFLCEGAARLMQEQGGGIIINLASDAGMRGAPNAYGISKWDAYNQYLAYHEGHGGYKRKTFRNKDWLVKVAKKVDQRARDYGAQLKRCESSLDKGWSLWPF